MASVKEKILRQKVKIIRIDNEIKHYEEYIGKGHEVPKLPLVRFRLEELNGELVQAEAELAMWKTLE